MTKADLVRQIAAKAGITQVSAAKILEATLSSLSEVMIRGDSITLGGFGTFKLSEHKERKARNPSTGEAMIIPAHRMPRFSPGKELRALIEATSSKD